VEEEEELLGAGVDGWSIVVVYTQECEN